MVDNSTALLSSEYDNKIANTIPFYNCIHESIVDLVYSLGKPINKWLDTGCGTGTLCLYAKKLFSNTEFILADPSEQMLKLSNDKLKSSDKISFQLANTQSLNYHDESFDVITAILCHHYLDISARIQATRNCFRMLKKDGIFIVFENIRPLTKCGLEISLKRWENYQISMGKTTIEAAEHIKRFDKEYFPISIIDHINLLNETGFNAAEVLWTSYVQAGFYAIK